jgi:hypothetical protein
MSKYKEVNCAEPSPSVRLPWPGLFHKKLSICEISFQFQIRFQFLMTFRITHLITLPGPQLIRGQCYKTFYSRKLCFSQLARAFVPGKPFQPCLMFAGKVRSLPHIVTPERCFTRVGSGCTRIL